jgi:phage-related protein
VVASLSTHDVLSAHGGIHATLWQGPQRAGWRLAAASSSCAGYSVTAE